ncbi:class I SAM-dependent methyltransferase [Rhodovibrio sodomensis]|uniref:class I SAM-dependent methyltransferase n=1 Tax=Rhodovibrio sodomensis TaxID=1088 RepID=UPI001907BEF7
MSVIDGWGVAAIVAAIGLTGLALALYVRRKVRLLSQRIDRARDVAASRATDASYLARVLPPTACLPRPTNWSLGGDTLHWLLSEVERRRPRLVVDLGGGLSTVLLGLRLKELGCGQVVSVDHDAGFAATTQAFVSLNALDGIVEVRVAPLTANTALPGKAVWYDTDKLADLRDVDLLVIDGPPMSAGKRVREAALTFFQERFAADWMAVLDDAHRPGERAILESWRGGRNGFAIDVLPFATPTARIFPAQASEPSP